MIEVMRFTVKRITIFNLQRADAGEDFLGESDHKSAEQTQEALGTLACVVALDGHADLDDAPAEDDNAYRLDCREDEVGEIVDHGDRIGVGGKGGGAEHGDADRQHTPKAEKELRAFVGFQMIHSVSAIIDKRYRMS